MIEDKLDKIIDLLEKLTNETTVINTPITVKSEDKNAGIDVNKHLYELVNKVQRRTSEPKRVTNEEFTQRLKEIDWAKIIEPKIKIACKDEKSEIFTLEGTIQENRSIVCEPMTESRIIVGWSLKKDG